ncbi:hypothetical protein SAMN05421678_113200 [Actinopolymorpha cephalotaxi]|uniref:ARB-07466-like C-terminal domain-containing protein n=1 Tax=Actinopolymorpha cephalotaxi TaxID=504797 RepID=A0A1I2Y424_9ACTN|nr:hypothetical protein [Actinopolymorpha cephalotaxi]NYH87321.1 hypothetical protein [Actinopolymorpha cephalotaxi]SFH20433.1 hypothetical protein SAMN05421678_113200 [Actinopolymorpha cephalotaxi]
MSRDRDQRDHRILRRSLAVAAILGLLLVAGRAGLGASATPRAAVSWPAGTSWPAMESGRSVASGEPISTLGSATSLGAITSGESVRSAAFGPWIDPYAPYVGQWLCDPTPKPGVVDVLNLVRMVYRPRWWGISGTCAGRMQSEHKEGRALDIAFNARSPRERAAAEDFLRWLLAPDQYGNQNAMARRLGVMYIIWDHQIWRSYRASSGWQPYSGTPNPHTDHIHISFSWQGALRQTSWWRQGGPAAPGGAGTELPPTGGRIANDSSR